MAGLKLLGEVAGIGGIALGVFLFLFRDIIRKVAFKNLTPSQGYRVLRMLIGGTIGVTLAGIVAYAYAVSAENTQQTTSGDLSPAISDVDGDVVINGSQQ
jgi:hypothetical protein